MPVSTTVHIAHCAQILVGLNPQSVLDIGCGFGMWGFLARYCLDIMQERVHPDTWQVRIDGIEVFEPYIQAHQRALYTSIRIADIRDIAGTLETYDLIIAGDVIEHLDKQEGEHVLGQLYGKAGKGLLVNIPIGPGWEHPAGHGNPAELHRSQWEISDFDSYPSLCKEFELPCGRYASFLLRPNCTVQQRVDWLHTRAHHYQDAGDGSRALACARKAHALEPKDAHTTLFLVDLLVQAQEWDEALETLREGLEADPEFHYARLVLARLLTLRAHREEARACIEVLLASADVPQKIALDAQALLKKLEG